MTDALRHNMEIIMSNILIVDDQPHLRELFSQELMDEGHKVRSFISVRLC